MDQLESIKKEELNKCSSCNKVFAYNSSLIKHMRIHTGERPYVCNSDGCNQRFSQVSNLIRHKRVHSGFKPFCCKECDKSFSSSSNLKQHLNVHKTFKNRSKYTCFVNNCCNSYLYICTLKKHLLFYHKSHYDILEDIFKEMNFYQIYKTLRKSNCVTDIDPRLTFINFKDIASFSGEEEGSCEDENVNEDFLEEKCEEKSHKSHKSLIFKMEKEVKEQTKTASVNPLTTNESFSTINTNSKSPLHNNNETSAQGFNNQPDISKTLLMLELEKMKVMNSINNLISPDHLQNAHYLNIQNMQNIQNFQNYQNYINIQNLQNLQNSQTVFQFNNNYCNIFINNFPVNNNDNNLANIINLINFKSNVNNLSNNININNSNNIMNLKDQILSMNVLENMKRNNIKY